MGFFLGGFGFSGHELELLLDGRFGFATRWRMTAERNFLFCAGEKLLSVKL